MLTISVHEQSTIVFNRHHRGVPIFVYIRMSICEDEDCSSSIPYRMSRETISQVVDSYTHVLYQNISLFVAFYLIYVHHHTLPEKSMHPKPLNIYRIRSAYSAIENRLLPFAFRLPRRMRTIKCITNYRLRKHEAFNSPYPDAAKISRIAYILRA